MKIDWTKPLQTIDGRQVLVKADQSSAYLDNEIVLIIDGDDDSDEGIDERIYNREKGYHKFYQMPDVINSDTNELLWMVVRCGASSCTKNPMTYDQAVDMVERQCTIAADPARAYYIVKIFEKVTILPPTKGKIIRELIGDVGKDLD